MTHARHSPRFAVYSSSVGNYFFDEIRDLVVCGLKDLGYSAWPADERKGFLVEADRHVVIAPHEFFVLGLGMKLRQAKLPRRLILFNTEQTTSPWFDLARGLFPMAWAVWDMDLDTARLVSAKGFGGRHVPLGYSRRFPLFSPVRRLPLNERTSFLEPAARRWPGSWKLGARPLDVFFAGFATKRRDLFFTRHASSLARFRACFHFTEESSPVRPERPGSLDSQSAIGLAQRSKIILNLHRAQSRYFEWHRIVLHGIGQRALVLSEPVGAAPILRAGKDFIEAPLNDIPGRLDLLLETAAGRRLAQDVATHGYETFSSRCQMADFLRPVVDELLSGSEVPTPQAAASAFAGPERLAGKIIAPAKLLCRTGRGGAAPLVSVAVSLRDYRRYIVPCLESVRKQTLPLLDLIVVDDGSRDGSERLALRWLKRHDGRFSRALLLRRSVSAGLPSARNSAFAQARTPFVFVLDADNMILPACLERLLSAIKNSKEDFAYSHFSAFGEEEFLKNIKPWDPALLRSHPYLDAMALIRRSAWKKVGGYRPEMVYGREDYDFWLRLARLGGRGVQVPQILARYRVHMRSMVNSETVPYEHRLKGYFQREHGLALDSDGSAQPGLGSGIFAGGRLSVRVESPAQGEGDPRRGKYLVTALTILSDLNRDLVDGTLKSARRPRAPAR